MQKWMKWIGAVVLLWAGAVFAGYGDYAEYEWTDGHGVRWYCDVGYGYSYATVWGADPSSGALTIPQKIAGHAVKSIGEWSFFGCKNVTSVKIPATVEWIGRNAFTRCTGLKTVYVHLCWKGKAYYLKDADLPTGCKVVYYGSSTVALNANGGSGGTGKVTATYGKAMPKVTIPKKTGYKFLGYYSAKTGGTKYWTSSGASARNWNGKGTAYTFYAHWARISTITINKAGGTGGTSKVVVTNGFKMRSISVPTRAGYSLLGIYNKADEGAKYWNADGTPTRAWNGTAATYTFYAHWLKKTTSKRNSKGATPETKQEVRGQDAESDGPQVIARRSPINGVVVFNGPLAVALGDADVGGNVADGDESTVWIGDEGVGEWHLLLSFAEAQSVGGIQLVGENLPNDGVTFAIGLEGGVLEPWDGATGATFDEVLLSIANPDGIAPVVREVYFPLSADRQDL